MTSFKEQFQHVWCGSSGCNSSGVGGRGDADMQSVNCGGGAGVVGIGGCCVGVGGCGGGQDGCSGGSTGVIIILLLYYSVGTGAGGGRGSKGYGGGRGERGSEQMEEFLKTMQERYGEL